MNPVLSPRPTERELRETLRTLVADRLGMHVTRLDDAVPLVRYGLDSLAAAEVGAEIEDSLGVHVPTESWGPEARLSDLLDRCRVQRDPNAHRETQPDENSRIAADAILPADLVIPRQAGASARDGILLTGATGFLGRALLVDALRRGRSVDCVVRAANDAEASARVRATLPDELRQRASLPLRAWSGDVGRRSLGLDDARRSEIQPRVGVVVHAGARVDWTRSYGELRGTNVGGTVEAVRVAADWNAELHLLSSLLVLHADPARDLDESAQPFEHVHQLPIGYARTKAVAEQLVCSAASRGLRVAIHRPGLITFDRASGRAAPDDLLRRVLHSCLLAGCAPDLQWPLAACSVDHIAAGLLDAPTRRGQPWVEHWVQRREARWLELVLFLRLRGHPIQRVGYEEWARRTREAATDPRHPLHPLRSFFFRPGARTGGLPPARFYEEARRGRLCHDRSHAAQSARRSLASPLSAHDLRRWFEREELEGGLPRARTSDRVLTKPPVSIEERLRSVFDGARVVHCRPLSGESILSELVAGMHESAAGLYEVEAEDATGRRRRHIVKVKASEDCALDAATTLAELCSRDLGRAFRRWRHRLETAGAQQRELAVARLPCPALRRLAPAATISAGTSPGEASLVLEDLRAQDRAHFPDPARALTTTQIQAALQSMAAVHSQLAGDEMRDAYRPPDAAEVEAMSDLWSALAHHASPSFRRWGGARATELLAEAVEGVGARRSFLDTLPPTLCHGDFNPRNLMFHAARPDTDAAADGLEARAYDWELARLDTPVRDVMELLSFALPEQTSREELDRWLEFHRRQLADRQAAVPDADRWRRAARCVLLDLFHQRWTLYAMVDRFRAQPFLPRLVRRSLDLAELIG